MKTAWATAPYSAHDGQLRAIADAYAASMNALGEATYHSLLHVVQIAATSAVLTAMVAQPEKAASYEDVLAAIKRLG